MDIEKSLTFVTEDPSWVGKIGIGAGVTLLAFLIIPIPLLVGYLVGTTRNVKNGEQYPMPAWEDWGQLYKDGLAIIAAQLVYTLPFWVLMCIAFVGTIAFGGLSETNEDLAAVGILTTFGLVFCLFFLFAIVLAFLSPAIVVQYVRTDQFGATFRFGEVFRLAMANIANILIIFLVSFGLNFVLNLVVAGFGLIPCIGWIISFLLLFAATPYLLVVTGHLYGQMAAQTEQQLI